MELLAGEVRVTVGGLGTVLITCPQIWVSHSPAQLPWFWEIERNLTYRALVVVKESVVNWEAEEALSITTVVQAELLVDKAILY